MEGLFNLARTLFRIEIEAADGLARVWNNDVRFYRVKDSTEIQLHTNIMIRFLDHLRKGRKLDKCGCWLKACALLRWCKCKITNCYHSVQSNTSFAEQAGSYDVQRG
ncbi:uncharacterized protein LOC120293143 [Eucalyptus grandis]|uniref:uncharacterized protein LOC120293143 n=1 Tax=Eucalyptus grandis TaxID=71139 RepID=UPI00192EEF08|nr:uncharacterized protein LOC120293143 [Eucalyptus grandis]XP_039167891.1 uncharacterized protein LOC120293143 [Eucalyptus grandis]